MTSADPTVVNAMLLCLDTAKHKGAAYLQVEGQDQNGVVGLTLVAMPNQAWGQVKKLLAKNKIRPIKVAGPKEDRL